MVNSELNEVTDEELARQTRAGSSDAFEALVWRYERRIFAFACQLLHHHTDAREVTQETFVKVFQSMAGFDPRRPFAPWLFSIARRKCIDRCRARGATSAEAQSMPEPSDPDSPLRILIAREDREALWDCARRILTPLQYQALWLRYAEEMDVAQTAQALGKTKIHVKVLLFRARQSLSRCLPEAEAPGRNLAQPQQPGQRALEPKPAPPGRFMALPHQKEFV